MQVRLTMLFACVCGLAAAGLLLACTNAVQAILQLEDAVLRHAVRYWWVRCSVVPLQLWGMGMSGILQGCDAAPPPSRALSIPAQSMISRSQ